MPKPRSIPRGEFLRREPPELHSLASFVHGALTALHTLGALYNYRRKNWHDVAVHVAAALYDLSSVGHHQRMQRLALRAGTSATWAGSLRRPEREPTDTAPPAVAVRGSMVTPPLVG